MADNGRFNPRTRTGCDIKKFMMQRLSIMFQSTHPHWVRLFLAVKYIILYPVSIHAPALGATRITGNMSRNYWVSIHAPALGATPDKAGIPGVLVVSIHAPALGAT